jgi:outer membrane protein OmpA-like peptidoglycan-associated protein
MVTDPSFKSAGNTKARTVVSSFNSTVESPMFASAAFNAFAEAPQSPPLKHWAANKAEAVTVYFPAKKTTVPTVEQGKIDFLAKVLTNNPGLSIKLTGYTDKLECSSEEEQRVLEERRALAIKKALVNAGVSPENVDSFSYGKDKSVTFKSIGSGGLERTNNRRVDVGIVPKDYF